MTVEILIDIGLLADIAMMSDDSLVMAALSTL